MDEVKPVIYPFAHKYARSCKKPKVIPAARTYFNVVNSGSSSLIRPFMPLLVDLSSARVRVRVYSVRVLYEYVHEACWVITVISTAIY